MEAMRRRLVEQQLAEMERKRQQQQQHGQPPVNPEISNIKPRDKHAAKPKVKLYQPLNVSLPSAYPTPSLSSASSTITPATTASFSTSATVAASGFPIYGELIASSDPEDELDPRLEAIDPTIDAATRDKQLQEMIASMVMVADFDVSQAKLDGMKCVLLPHQIQGVQWMKEREKGQFKGGILADDMGLGKTVQTLALIVTNRPGMEGASIDTIADEPSEKENVGTKAKAASSLSKAEIKSTTTLIIAPVAVVRQWEQEVHDKTDAGLKVYVHHGPSRSKTAAKFSKYDIVITTYTTAASEYANLLANKEALALSTHFDSDGDSDLFASDTVASDTDSDPGIRALASKKKTTKVKPKPKNGTKPPANRPAPLFEADWLRVVLDEAQNIKNLAAKCSKACYALSRRAHSRWCLSGTPIQNNCYELFSLIHFLRIEPFNNYTHFKEKIGDPLKSSNQNRVNWGMKRLCVVLQTIMLRRTKDATYEGKPILKLPTRTVETVLSDFDQPEEKEFYENLQVKIRKNLDEAEKNGDKQQFIVSLIMLLRLRQACSHPALVLKSVSSDISAATMSTGDSTGVGGGVGDKENADDDGLADLLSGLTVGSKHCERCHETLPVDTDQKRCSDCAVEVARMESKGIDWLQPDAESTKIRTMLRILDEIRKKDRTEKTIVFSQFTSFLDLVEPFLKKNKFNFTRYDGTMRPTIREANLEKIRSDPATTIILISFKAGSTGLNLTCCSQVILMDLWWNPQIEEQAFDRAHRLGQTRPVHIHKLSIVNTVEERILDLQKRKRALAQAALEGSKLAKANKLDKKELHYLFNGGPKDN